MILTEGLLEMIRRHEGLRLKKYLCPGGHATIGYGWNMDAHPLPDDIAACLRVTGAITQDMADRLLNISVDMATRQARAIYPGFDDFSERRRYALVDFVFNLGAAGALKFRKMRNAIEVRDWDRAADQMMDSKWFQQVGNRGREIVNLIREG